MEPRMEVKRTNTWVFHLCHEERVKVETIQSHPFYHPLPSLFLHVTGIALHRHLMIMRVGGLLPKGQGCFKAYRLGFLCKGNYTSACLCYPESMAKNNGTLYNWLIYFFYTSTSCVNYKREGVPQCLACSSYLSILPIRIPPRFPLKMQTLALPSR